MKLTFAVGICKTCPMCNEDREEGNTCNLSGDRFVVPDYDYFREDCYLLNVDEITLLGAKRQATIINKEAV